MSKNFELMQRMGVEEKPFAEPRIETRVHVEESVAATYKPRPILGLNQMSREQTLKLIQRVFLLQSELAPRLVVFAGIEQGNGCSQVCSDAAKILAMNVSGSVCLVDANLRAPSLADTFHIPNHNGLTDALCGDQPVRHFTSPLGPENLSLLSSGSFFEDSSKLLNSDRLKKRFAELRTEFDYILVDAPPLTAYADAIPLAQISDGLVLILEANATRREAALDVMQSLHSARIRILGAVLNKRTFPIPDALYRRV
jgi:Mrp family chromosome partitioning ATPase